jgi:hypothetical protein
VLIGSNAVPAYDLTGERYATGWLDDELPSRTIWSVNHRMRRARQIVAIVALTTALCADRAVSAAPLARPQVGEIAARLAARISRSFARTVHNQNVRVVMHRPLAQTTADARFSTVPEPVVAHCVLSPFQFRLPPPVPVDFLPLIV